MKEKKVTITAKGASQKQWSTLILELNIMRKEWKRYGVDLAIHTFKVDSIIKRGTSNKSLTSYKQNLKEE